MFEEGMDVLWKAWTEDGFWSHHGEFYHIDDMSITPKADTEPDPLLRGVVLGNVFQDGGEERPQYHLRAVRGLDGLMEALAAAVDSYRNNCVAAGNEPGRAMCSYFIHIADTPEEDDFGRQAMMDYFKYCVLRAFPDDPETMPPTMHYFMQINEILRNMEKDKLSKNSVLIGNAAAITEQLKEVEEAGIDECIPVFQRR